jgi:predicted lipoprotein with Yx(FWY)xxD motif
MATATRWQVRGRVAGIGTAVLAAGLVLTACGSSGGSPAGGAQSSPAGNAHATGTTIEVHSGPMGQYLTDQSGRTLYLFEADTANKSHCSNACLTYWPLFKGPAKAGSGVNAGMIGTITTDGQKQATYAGHPLYYYAPDTKPGQISGQGNSLFGGLWWIVAPSGKAITSTSAGGSSSSSSSSGGGGGGGGWA